MRGRLTESVASDGIFFRRGALAKNRLIKLKAAIDALYAELESARKNGDTATIASLIREPERFIPTASSFTLGAILGLNLTELLTELTTSAAGAWIKNALGERLMCNLDQSWVRRQYAPSRYPLLHAPHGWHQDGALKFDFLSRTNRELPPDAMLSMVTCWISLDACGLDAPGLELVAERLDGLLSPQELRTDSLQMRFTSYKFWRPILESGDALLFRGDILHRTHVLPTMTNDRTSIELRFFSAAKIIERLQADRFVPIVTT